MTYKLKNQMLSVVLLLSSTTFFTSCKKATLSEDTSVVQTEAVTKKLANNQAGKSSSIFGNGVNLQPSYYNGGNPNFGWSLMKSQTKIKTVRIEIEPGYVTQAKSWISQARNNGYAVIATYHNKNVLGSDNSGAVTTAANWWKTNYSNLASAGSFTINLINEWGSHNISSNNFASTYNTAISIVRTVYGGRIIIDIPGYGQETKTGYDAVKGTNGTKINDANIIMSAHIYPGAYNQGRNRYVTNADLNELNSCGRDCMLGEFGNSGGSGANWSGLVDYAKGLGWAVMAWAWNGDGGSMNMVSPAWSSNGAATSFSLSSYFNTAYGKL